MVSRSVTWFKARTLMRCILSQSLAISLSYCIVFPRFHVEISSDIAGSALPPHSGAAAGLRRVGQFRYFLLALAFHAGPGLEVDRSPYLFHCTLL